MPTPKTTEQFKKEVYDLVGDEYEVIGEYQRSKIPITLKHNKKSCLNIFNMRPTDFLSGQRCSLCYGTPKKTTEQFKKEVYDLVGDEYEVIGEYQKNCIKIAMRHNICGYEYTVLPTNFKKGDRCPNCRYKKVSSKMKNDNEYMKKKIKKVLGDEYLIKSNYEGYEKPIKIKHKPCNKIYETNPKSIFDGKISGGRCPNCIKQIHKLKTTEQFKKEVYDLVGDEYTLKEGCEYINCDTKVILIHNKCGNEYIVTPDRFLYGGTRCIHCKKDSKGVIKIENFLKKNNLSYEREFKIKECKNIRSLPFDFKINKKDGTFILIEYDGEQHFSSINTYGYDKEETLKKIQFRDNIKNNFCKRNNIELIRISYKDYNNINKILKEKLSHKKLQRLSK